MDWGALGSEAAKLGLVSLGAVLPIPGGAAIGAALASAIGSGSGKPDDILATLTANADAVAKAKQFELTHEEVILKAHLDYQSQIYAQEVSDRASARAMQMSTRAWATPALAFVVTLGFFGLLGFMCWHDVPTSSKDMLNIMTGSLGTAWVSIIAFYFGSSNGSQQKDVLLANSMPAK